MYYNLLSKNIYKFECELLKSEVRKSSQKIAELIATEFVEFTSSGRIVFYEKGEVFQEKDDNTELNWEIRDFHVRELSNEWILATYKVIKHDEIDESKKYSLRSSIWKCFDGNWKMIFHQGTLTSKKIIIPNVI
ncbi:DUF4440 domain-containing protein [Clostridium sp. D53t1_180928_C8]|uniref:nuclear transport factor 2 family protein n=1 Tax=Clostridium sp. D53t1_180928_C8 TaxID=2787101 RepID=UPI0018AAA06B|nr:DUF4440 domain-containing protein [Clostridium sp. D53t1_180928_C8]